MKLLLALLAPAVLVALPAIARGDDTTPVAKPAKADKPKKICHEVPNSNSRIPKRTCKTAAEWADDANRDIEGVTGNRKTQ